MKNGLCIFGAIGAVVVMVVCGGCLTAHSPENVKAWTIEPAVAVPATVARLSPDVTPAKVTRLGGITVLAPFDGSQFVVRRGDGSVASDPCNIFASSPASLLRLPTMAALNNDSRFGRVVPQTSISQADTQIELLVTDLSVDCSKEGERRVRSAVTIDVVRNGDRGREVMFSGSGRGEADAASGNYSSAFSSAVNTALAEALAGLK